MLQVDRGVHVAVHDHAAGMARVPAQGQIHVRLAVAAAAAGPGGRMEAIRSHHLDTAPLCLVQHPGPARSNPQHLRNGALATELAGYNPSLVGPISDARALP